MATVRFFAQAKDAAGCARSESSAATVGGVLEDMIGRFGDPLAAVIRTSAVWLNGEAASPDDAVSAHDEVAVLPPVSGG